MVSARVVSDFHPDITPLPDRNLLTKSPESFREVKQLEPWSFEDRQDSTKPSTCHLLFFVYPVLSRKAAGPGARKRRAGFRHKFSYFWQPSKCAGGGGGGGGGVTAPTAPTQGLEQEQQ